MTEIIGFTLSIFIGVSLGLIGGGGSILTIPILVYIFGFKAEISTTYSLFIVGTTALTGAIRFYRNDLVKVKVALLFSIPSLISVFLTRMYIMPALPEVIFTIGGFQFFRPMLIMTVFAGLMIAASFSMIRKRKISEHPENKNEHNYFLIFIEGIAVGFLTGFVGAGGGFLIIPALVLLAGLHMKEAVGTSLLIIAINSLVGFSGDIFAGVDIDWKFLIMMSLFTVSGIVIGSTLAKKIPGEKLKPAFGWFVLVMGIYIMLRETVFKS